MQPASSSLLLLEPAGTPISIPKSAFLDSPIGSIIGGYRVAGELGQGGMGTVYLAEHPLIGRKAAIKILNPDLAGDPAMVLRFIAEARALSLVDHPYAVQLYDLQILPDARPCIIMELVEGESLEERARRAPILQPAEAVEILGQICEALSAAHARGVVHRDIKADNVLLVEKAGRTGVKILDFGVAKVSHTTGLTEPGMPVGTPAYMAPEQILGKAVDGRADLYSVGVLAYRLLVGRLPFSGATAMETMRRQLREAPPPPQGLGPGLTKAVLKALAKQPEDRYPDAASLAAALRNGLQMQVSTPRERQFTVEVAGPQVQLRFFSAEAFAAVEQAEISKGRLYVPAAISVPRGPLSLAISVPGRGTLEYEAELAVRVGPDQARRWGLEPGFALAVKRRAAAGGLPAAKLRAQEIAAVLERLEARARGNHYAFLEIRDDADFAAVRAACQQLDAELTRALEGAVFEQLGRLQGLRARLEQARGVLGEPEPRARFDAALGNFRGVARSMAGGLSPDGLERLHAEFVASNGERVSRAVLLAATAADFVRMGDFRHAAESLERALWLDPLDPSLHQRYLALRRDRVAVPAATFEPP